MREFSRGQLKFQTLWGDKAGRKAKKERQYSCPRSLLSSQVMWCIEWRTRSHKDSNKG